MKAVWIILGTLGGVYALFGVYLLVNTITTVDATSTYGPTVYGGSIAAVCIGLIVCLLGFQKAFPKAPTK